MAANDKPIDILSVRLVQARGALTAVIQTFDPTHGFQIEDKDLYAVLWAVEELLSQANEAFEALPVPVGAAA